MSTSWVLVCPYVYTPYFDECMATIKLPSENILAVDNTQNNRGVANSWNLGIDRLKETNADWLILMSATIRFGLYGGLDMLEQLEKYPEADVVHFGTKKVREQRFKRGEGPSYEEGNLGWHCSAVSREVIDKVGYFDPNFYPSYFEDLDYDLRINKALGGSWGSPKWFILPIDASSAGLRHAVELGGVKTPVNDLIAYFATKWGRHPSAAKLGEYDHPFDDKNNSLAFFPPAHGRMWDA